jgi:hypothetical protein
VTVEGPVNQTGDQDSGSTVDPTAAPAASDEAGSTPPSPAAGPQPLAEQFEQALADYTVDSASLRARVLTGTGKAQRDLAAGQRTADTTRRRPRRRPHSSRPAAGPASGRPGGAHRAGSGRPRLVTAGALAAVVSVIGVSAGIASVVQSESKPRVLMTPAPPGPITTPSVVPPPAAPTSEAAVTASATPSTDPSQPTTDPAPDTRAASVPSTGSQRQGSRSGQGGQAPSGQSDRPRAVRGWGVAPIRSGSDLVLPGRTTSDWVVFGEGHGGVAARAAIPFQLLDVGRIAGVGTAQRGYPTSVSWVWGTPRAQASHSTTRLRIPGNRTATMTTYRGSHGGRLALYLGGTSSLRVTVSAAGMQSSSFSVTLPSSTAVVTLDLSSLPYWTPATISAGGGGGSSFSLAAVVLD